MSAPPDNRKVVLLKSLRTNNRFYTLVHPESGLHNADTVPDFPDDQILGIAYPCLEDGLNDFAVIRTTFETIDLFADDQELRQEMMGIINDARGNLQLRLIELRDRIASGQAHFLGTDLQEFKESLLHLTDRGAIRRTLDNMMKVDVFESVTQAEAQNGAPPEPMYRYEFSPVYAKPETLSLPSRPFVSLLFDDVLVAVNDDSNYGSKYLFDRNVFQKFIALMFVNYATTDRMFHGTSREDYGVSGDREMDQTPLYQAVGIALRQLERGEAVERFPEPGYTFAGEAAIAEPVDNIFGAMPDLGDLVDLAPGTRMVELPAVGLEQLLVEPFVGIADALRLLEHVDQARVEECSLLINRAARQLFDRLKQLKILPPMVQSPLPPEKKE